MRRMIFIALFALVLCVSGCAEKTGYVVGPLGFYTHEAFITEGTGETALYIDGEPWYALIAIHGFKYYGDGMESDTQFLSRKDEQGGVVKIFASKIDDVKDDTACRVRIYRNLVNRYTAKAEFQDLGDKRILTYTLKGKRYVDYCPYYKGYCFDFHFAMDEKIKIETLKGVIDSIAFIDDEAFRTRISRLFSVYDRRIQISVPPEWKHVLRGGIQYDPSIVFTPAEGNDFKIFLLPCAGFKGQTFSEETLHKKALSMMARWDDRASEKPSLQELRSVNSVVFYFDVTDKYYYKEDPGAYPFQREGVVIIGDIAFSFTIYYRENTKQDADKGLNAIARLGLLDPPIEPIVSLPK